MRRRGCSHPSFSIYLHQFIFIHPPGKGHDAMRGGGAAQARNFGNFGESGACSHCCGVWGQVFRQEFWMGICQGCSGRAWLRNASLKNFQPWVYPSDEFLECFGLEEILKFLSFHPLAPPGAFSWDLGCSALGKSLQAALA